MVSRQVSTAPDPSLGSVSGSGDAKPWEPGILHSATRLLSSNQMITLDEEPRVRLDTECDAIRPGGLGGPGCVVCVLECTLLDVTLSRTVRLSPEEILRTVL